MGYFMIPLASTLSLFTARNILRSISSPSSPSHTEASVLRVLLGNSSAARHQCVPVHWVRRNEADESVTDDCNHKIHTASDDAIMRLSQS